MMKMSYLNEVQKCMMGRAKIPVSQRTSRLLEGSYASIYHGRSMNFDELREYHPGDEVRDIDWKASARSPKILVRQYIAEKKHNILLVPDSSIGMSTDSPTGVMKSELAWITGGMFWLIAQKNGDYVGAVYGKGNTIARFPFRTELYHIETILAGYARDVISENKVPLEDVLWHILEHIKSRSVLLVVTDLNGISRISASLLRKCEVLHDLLFVVTEDMDMYGSHVYDVEAKTYLPSFLTQNRKLLALQQKKKQEMIKECEKKLHQNEVQYVMVQKKEEIEKQLIELLKQHRSERHGI